MKKRGERMKGTVFSVQEFSVYDGPGIRTSVFLKGCPLHCSWCHNPEGQNFKPEIVRSPNGCRGCGACERAAVQENGEMKYTLESVKNCPEHLLRVCGREQTAEEIFNEVMKNKEILSGVTFSGGEPLAQANFLLSCLKLLKGKLHTAVQTSGFAKPSDFKKIMSLADYFLYDIKLINENAHKKYAGASNQNILFNFKTLADSGKLFVVRVPLIPCVTDTEENIQDICAFLKKNNVRYAELLPYNKMAGGKYKMAGRIYRPDFDASVPVRIRENIWSRYNIEIKVL